VAGPNGPGPLRFRTCAHFHIRENFFHAFGGELWIARPRSSHDERADGQRDLPVILARFAEIECLGIPRRGKRGGRHLRDIAVELLELEFVWPGALSAGSTVTE
ncbi:MAG TPA: hypothetical protein VGK31_01695, partial [Thermoanaerobaculia bacterium]